MSNPLLTIGLAVYNGEKRIRRSLDSLLEQTFSNFELVISDNASTDSTQIICQEYAKKDKRIRYIRQPKNIGAFQNFYFLQQNANSKYFMWAADDDFWDPTFVEKNIEILETKNNVVGSISQILFFQNIDDLKIKRTSPLKFLNIKMAQTVTGSYPEKVISCLKFRFCSHVYGIFRTEKLHKSMVQDEFPTWDLRLLLSVVKYGDLNAIDDVLMYRSSEGESNKSDIQVYINNDISLLNIPFQSLRLILILIKEHGIVFFLKNLSVFIRVFGNGLIVFISQIQKYFKTL